MEMEIQIAGTLYWQDYELPLYDPHPMIDKGMDAGWMTDQDEKFLVIRKGKIVEWITRGAFSISRERMGERVTLILEEREETKDLNVDELIGQFKEDLFTVPTNI